MSDFGPGRKFMLNRARATCAFCMWATCISLIQQRSGSREVSIMPELIEILREDHRNIETLLLVLERELDIFDRAEQPDYEVVQAIIDYFRDYPDRCHHPKEDAVFAKLKTRDPRRPRASGISKPST